MFITIVPRRTPTQMHRLLRQLFGDQRSLFRLHAHSATVLTPLPLGDTSVPLETAFEAGEEVMWRVRLNPVASRKTQGRGPKYVVPSDQRIEWATARLFRAGLDVADVREHDFGSAPIHRGGARVIWADFEGTATVRDPSALSATMTSGLGRQKAFGCGLLEVTRVRQIV